MITEGGYCSSLQAACNNTSEIMESPFSSEASQRFCGTGGHPESFTAEDTGGRVFFEHPICEPCELNNSL